MKKLFILFLLCVGSNKSYSQPVVYFDFLSHDEDTGPWNQLPYYKSDRDSLIRLATYFQSNGISYNMQSDYLYLNNVLSKETPSLKLKTGGKNILQWMVEDMGVEMDPHSHETSYIYPDIVKLMDSLGLPESKLIGGSLYKEENGTNLWTNLVDGQYGVIFPDKFWKPDYLMGGGSKNHVADLNYYGFWNPKDTANYLVHDTTTHLRHIGTGCGIKLYDTSSVAYIVAKLKDVVNKVQNGQYPANGFYVQTIFFGHGDLISAGFYDKLIELADSANAIVASGKAQWKTLKQAYTLWETDYNAQLFQQECSEFVSALSEISTETPIQFYPNPSSGMYQISVTNPEKYSISVYSAYGQELLPETKGLEQINLSAFSDGIYLIRTLDLQTGKESIGKLIKTE